MAADAIQARRLDTVWYMYKYRYKVLQGCCVAPSDVGACTLHLHFAFAPERGMHCAWPGT